MGPAIQHSPGTTETHQPQQDKSQLSAGGGELLVVSVLVNRKLNPINAVLLRHAGVHSKTTVFNEKEIELKLIT